MPRMTIGVIWGSVRPYGGCGVAFEGPMAQSSTHSSVLRIGSRGSPLALVQAREVQAASPRLRVAPEQIEIKIIRTTGDAIQDRPLAEAGGKGLFTKEIEEALLSGAIDLAVHSSKDMPTVLPAGLMLAAFLPREDPRDAFIGRTVKSLARIAPGRQASAPRRCGGRRCSSVCGPDLIVVPMRGNVETRLRKLDAGEADATILAVAGLKRLGLLAAATAGAGYR